MSTNDFLAELRQKLSRLPANEQEDALSYYAEYLDDAISNEDAIEALGSPSRLAAQIMAEYSARMLDSNQTPSAAPPAPAPTQKAQATYNKAFNGLVSPSNNYTSGSYRSAPAEASAGGVAAPPASRLHWIVYVILGIFALPVALPLILAAFAILIALIVTCIAVIIAFVAVVVALFVGGVLSLFALGSSGLSIGSALLMIGSALAVIGLALLFVPLFIRLTVWLVHSVGQLASAIYNRLKRRSDTHEEK